MGLHDRAAFDLSKALELNPNDIRAYVERALTFRAMGENDKADLDLSAARRIDPARASAGRAQPPWTGKERKGEYDSAIEEYNEAITVAPSFMPALYNRGLAHKARGEYGKALVDFTKACELEPRCARGMRAEGTYAAVSSSMTKG